MCSAIQPPLCPHHVKVMLPTSKPITEILEFRTGGYFALPYAGLLWCLTIPSPNGTRHLDEFYSLTFPPLSDEVKAIEHVKLATLFTPDGGMSSAPVGQVISYYIQADNGATKGISWSASEQAGEWDVIYT
jgi:hypothetical protein